MHVCAGVSEDTGHWVSLLCSLTIEHGAQIFGQVGCSASCSSNSAVFTPHSAGAPSMLWSCPSGYMVLGSELRSGPQAYETCSDPFPHMQDGELALLHRSLANPAEMDTSHPSLTQANTPSSLIYTSASWVLSGTCCDIKNIAYSRDDSTCLGLRQMAQSPSLRNSESAQVRALSQYPRHPCLL